MAVASRACGTGRLMCLLLALTTLGIGSLARAGSIFDDDYVPPTTPPTVAPVTAPPAPTTSSTGRETPTAPAAPPVAAPAVGDNGPPVQAHPLLAVPTPTDQAQSRKLFKEAFAADLKDRTPAARHGLAVKLLAEADKVADNPSDRFVLLVGACDAAVEGGDLDLAGHAAGTAASLYKIDPAELSAAAVLKGPLRVSSRSQALTAIDEGLELENTLVRAGDYLTAARLLTALQPLAGHDQEMGPMLSECGKVLSETRQARDRAETARERLKKVPADPSANVALGEFLCFVNEDFSHGLPLLARSDDPMMRSVAKRELDGAADVTQQIAVGDGWWDLAEKRPALEIFKNAMRSRAKAWYVKAMAGGEVTGLRRTLLEQRIAAASGGGHQVTSLTELKETKADGMVFDSGWGLAKDSMNINRKNPFRFDGVEYEHGLGFNPVGGNTAHIVYDLGGRYRRFSGAVGINDDAGEFAASINFKIVVDGKELWRSQAFREIKIVEKFNVSVFGAQSLELQVDCDGPGHNAHCVWIEPKLEAR